MEEKKYTWPEFEDKIREIVSKELELSKDECTLDANLIDDLGADSLSILEIVIAIDVELGIELPEQVFENSYTISETIHNYLLTNPQDVLSLVETNMLSFRLRSDGTIQVSLQFEDGSWGYADGRKLLPSSLCLVTFSRWTEILKDLEELINHPKTREEDLQRFFEENPGLIAGDKYDTVIAQASIVDIEEGVSWRADFALAPINQAEFTEILELKLPQLQLTKKPRAGHVKFSAKVWDAISQLRDYGMAFDNPDVRERFKTKYEIDMYKPDLHLIAGRKWNLEWIDSIRRLRKNTSVQIENWDDVLDRLRKTFT